MRPIYLNVACVVMGVGLLCLQVVSGDPMVHPAMFGLAMAYNTAYVFTYGILPLLSQSANAAKSQPVETPEESANI